MKTLIYDEDQVEEFYRRVISSQERTEFDVDFFCIAARKKYMSEEEKQATRMGDTCMMEKTVVKKDDISLFMNKLHKVDAGLDWLTSNNGTRIPRSCMVFYMNINHTDMIYALKGLKMDLAVLEGELFDCLKKKGLLENIGNKVKGLNTLVLKAYQNPSNVSNKTWIDIDFDVSPENFSFTEIKEVMSSLKFKEESYVVIQTRGGYHILVNTPWISAYNKEYSKSFKEGEKFNKKGLLSVDKVISGLEKALVGKGFEAKEIIINRNGMVPIPGTIQGGVRVRILK